MVELMSRLVEEWTDIQTHKTDRTDGIVVEWVDESTDDSKAKETRHTGISTHSESPRPGYNFKRKPDLFRKFPQLLHTPKLRLK